MDKTTVTPLRAKQNTHRWRRRVRENALDLGVQRLVEQVRRDLVATPAEHLPGAIERLRV